MTHYNAITASRKTVWHESTRISPSSNPADYFTDGSEDFISISSADDIVLGEKPQAFLLNEILEKQQDPTVLLRNLRIALKKHTKSVAHIIANDPTKSSKFTPHSLPTHKAHFREWSGVRLCELLITLGFQIVKAGTTSDNKIVLSVCSSETHHVGVLASLGLPAPKNSMVITTEHADTVATGGIGSYVKEVEQVLGQKNRPIVLTVMSQPFTKLMTTPSVADNIIDIHSILRNPATTENTSDWRSSSVAVFHAVKLILTLYDQLHIIEFQEYQGIGARLVQAKQVGEISPDVRLVARCHGSQVYIDRASFDWSGMEKADEFELERISVELADEVSFPTQYLKNLYTSTGYRINDDASYIMRLPYSYQESPHPVYKAIKRLIFLGKRSEMKGFPSFYKAVKDLTDPTGKLYNKDIEEVCVVAAPGDAAEYDEKLKDLLKKREIRLKIGPLPRAEVLSLLQSSAADSIVCLPYGGDNHPVTVLEMVANRCRFVAYQSGGIPELIPQEFHTLFTCVADPIELAKSVNHLAGLSSKEVASIIDKLYSTVVKEQDDINNKIRESYERSVEPSLPTKNTANSYSSLATVLVPIYNTDLRYVSTVIDCLNQQSLAPAEVLFINDCSPLPGYTKKLHALIKARVSVPYRIIDHDVNLGLAGARNTALAHCKTKYLINLDSDDVVSNNFVFDYVDFMESNPEYSASVCALESFTDEDGWNHRAIASDYSYVGVGSCLVLGVSKNIFGHAGACVVAEDARKIGGWDASDRSKWEDWAFFLKMTSSGMHIFNFPKVNYFYRVSPGSMVRTYANYPAEMRIARNITGLSIWESHRLYAFIKDEAWRTVGASGVGEPDTLTYRVAKRVTQQLNKAPIAKKAARWVIVTGWGTAKKLRRSKS